MTLQEAIDQAAGTETTDDDTITISKDIKLSKGIVVPSTTEKTADSTEESSSTETKTSLPKKDINITIKPADGRNFTIYTVDVSSPMFTVPQGSTLTIDGDLTLTGSNKSSSALICGNGGNVVINNGTLKNVTTANQNGASSKGAVVMNGGNLTMTGGSIEKNHLSTGEGNAPVVLKNGAKMDLSGGTISSNEGSYNGAGGVLIDTGCSMTMSGGTIGSVDDPKTGNSAWRGGGVAVRGGDTIDSSTASTFIMSGGTIGYNKVNKQDDEEECGGAGVYIEGNASAVVKDKASITHNIAKGTGMGGGVATGCADPNEGYLPTSAGGAFLLDGGSITGNHAYDGGGVYSKSVNRVILKSGSISGNSADKLGGGVYIAKQPYTVEIGPAVVTENTAKKMGGGAWLCPQGVATGEAYDPEKYDASKDTKITLTAGLGGNGIAVYGNSVPEDGAGSDLALLKNVPATLTDSQGADKLVDPIYSVGNRMLGGSKINWYQDGVITNSKLGDINDWGTVQPGRRTGKLISGSLTSAGAMALKADPNLSETAKAAATKVATLLITNNRADQGGGIAGNGTYIIPSTPEQPEKPSNPGTDKPEPVKVTISAEKKMEGRTLEAEEFEFTLTGDNEEGKALSLTAKNDQDGKIIFDPITYTKTGTYTYTIAEEQGNAPNVTYDATEKTVTVRVTEDHGKLRTDVSYDGSDIIPVFENKYTPGNDTPDNPHNPGDNPHHGGGGGDNPSVNPHSGHHGGHSDSGGGSSSSGSGSGSSTGSPTTGDNTPIGLYAAMLGGAVLALAGIVINRKRRNQNR